MEVKMGKFVSSVEEFFEFHWQRLSELTQNPYITAQVLLRNMQLYQQENVRYLETQMNVRFMNRADGSRFPPAEALKVITDMLDSEAAKATGVNVRFQYALVRFTNLSGHNSGIPAVVTQMIGTTVGGTPQLNWIYSQTQSN